MDEDEKQDNPRPLFLSAQDPDTWQKPDDISWGDYSLKPGKALSARHKELARLLFLGKTQVEITAALGYTQPWISRLSQNYMIKEEVERLREKAFQATVSERLKDLGPEAMDAIEEGIRSPDMKLKDRTELAKWVVEKLDGKAAQKVDINADVNIGVFMDKLEQLRDAGQVLDVTPKPALPPSETSDANEAPEETEVDPLAEWLKKNL